MRRKILLFASLSSFLILTACAGQPSLSPTPTPPISTPMQFIGILPTSTTPQLPSPTPTGVPLPASTAVVYQIIRATIDIDALNLRKGPGFLFAELDVYAKGQKVDVIAQEPDGDWLFVQTPDYKSGWMNAHYVIPEGSLANVPAIMPVGVLVIKGHVYTHNHQPASMIGVKIQPVGSSDTSLQDEANTNANGEWYAFLPATFEGNLTIVPDAYSPESSAANASGSLVGSFPPPQTITLPVSAATWIDFYLEP